MTMTDTETDGDEYITRKEAAVYLKISERSVDRLINNKNFDGVQRIGRCVRIHKPSLDKYLARRRE